MSKEFIGILHGFLGTVFLMAFSGAFAELIELTHHGARRVKIGTAVMFVASLLLSFTGGVLYAIYRAPVPESARSKLLASSTPWAHTILMELKEFTGMFVPMILAVAVYIAWRHNAEMDADRTLRRVLAAVLVLAMLVTLLTFGLGAYITKTQPL
ncbi:MAG: hypothetical protein Q7S09_03805 [bacterium]|nr:hypothetical protein [bacterium]